MDEKYKKELNKELGKAKKNIKDKEKEIIKLRSELNAFKKVDSNIIVGGMPSANVIKIESGNKEQ